MNEVSFLNCPCCNSEDIVTGSIPYNFGEDIYIKCRTCGLKMQICSEYGWEERERRWNTRKPIENVLKQLKNEKAKYESLADSSNCDGYWREEIEYLAKAEMCEEAIEMIKDEVM